MEEAEGRLLALREALPVCPRGLEKREGADDVGLHERARPVDRAVDVALGGEVKHARRAVRGEEPRDLVGVADVHLFERVARIACDRRQRGEVARVGQLVDVDDGVVGVLDEVPDERGADESGAAGDEEGLLHSIRRVAARAHEHRAMRPAPVSTVGENQAAMPSASCVRGSAWRVSTAQRARAAMSA